jgi:hypothetical protein
MASNNLTRTEPFVISRDHLPDVSDVSRRISGWLISMEDEMVLLGREVGKAIFTHVEGRMAELPPFTVLPIDLRNVRFFDVSFADELVVRLCRRISSGEIADRFFLLTRVNPELVENLQVYLEDREQACLCEAPDGSLKILGAISKELQETYKYALEAGSITARELIEMSRPDRSSDLSINASSNRLARMNKMGLLAFLQSESVEAGGRQNVYVPVR